MNFIDVLQVSAALLALSSCGKAPELPTDPGTTTQSQPTSPTDPVFTAPPTTTTDPSNTNVTIESYAFYNTSSICAAMKSWNPSTTTIEFPVNSHQPATYWYVFRADGVWVADANLAIQGIASADDATTIVEPGALYQPPPCTISINNGQFVGVH